jgi:S1-C subfamily serine protease
MWGKETDYNIFPDSASLKAAWIRGTDKHSVCTELDFINPQTGDFRLKNGSAAFSVGFKNFTMDSFGVVSPRLKALAKKAPLPSVLALGNVGDSDVIDFMGAKLKNLTTLGERSATGMGTTTGVLVLEVTIGSEASAFLQANDVILLFNNRPVNKLSDLLEARMSVIGTNTEVVVLRNQKQVKKLIELNGKR